MTEEIKKCLYQRMKTIINNENSDDTSVCLAALVLCMLLPMPTYEQLTARSCASLDRIRYGEQACQGQTSEQTQEES